MAPQCARLIYLLIESLLRQRVAHMTKSHIHNNFIELILILYIRQLAYSF